ncbi:MAG TPA: hypothetical protein PLQ13_08995 [Candidatus Krumholzibacteria bacterium]|nr:hypothetical protein [Candidatus Krumholzibacteria bacterium]
MSKHIDVLLLLALPASGKSEVRRYLASLTPEQCHDQFGIGHTVQLDDFPYVHIMRRVSDELTARGHEGAFFISPALPFRDPVDWLTLIELINEDYDDVVNVRRPNPGSAALWVFDRIDAARVRAGGQPVIGALPAALRDEIARPIEDEARTLLNDKLANTPDSLEGKTVVIEFARGGADGSPLPLPRPFGYRHSLQQLSPAILGKASILYIWVTPEESRRKNTARTDPNDPGSILHHGVPMAVMYGDYGVCDMAWMLEQSDRPDTVRLEKDGAVFHLPLGRFDNRVDKTTFIREDKAAWSAADVAALQAGMRAAFDQLAHGSGD